MRRSGTGSGGGYGSRNVRHVSAPKQEPYARKMRVEGVGQLGQKQGSHVTSEGGQETSYRGEKVRGGGGYNVVGPTSLLVSGPGGGRKVYGSGSQSTHGSVAPGSPRPQPAPDVIDDYRPNLRR
jgi:hypothetical protein